MFNEGEADIIVGDEPEGDANSVADTNSDTDATPGEVVPTPWKEVQESSTMLDISLTDSEDGCGSDEDYTEDLADTELSYGIRRKRSTSESSLLRDVDVVFRIPTAQGQELKELDEFPVAFVKEMTRKFNKDYLGKSKHRKQYRKMMEEVDDAETCVYRELNPKPKGEIVMPAQPEPRKDWYDDPMLSMYDEEEEERCEERHQRMQQRLKEVYGKKACDDCYTKRRLCARFIKTVEDEPRLVIYPLGPAEMNGGDWRGMRFWVRKPGRER
ncbi:hypothetical protein BKA58DRAFT_444025 [Alternaria rosae]|uniref:uncharacterized protein n=1 Tax=Alternaria rosae TaxID=1187941 RepID=UPI001E8E0577|nr:uncharacterized protein BKA58DRAFT_444025 [Alternaria rosae]KAH6858839.1 hypothetical protein BKA58DRAFT_444025 [Alternaria rosae]